MSNTGKKKFRLRSRFSDFRFRDWKFTNGMLETDDPKVVDEFTKQPFFGGGGDVWLDDPAETDAIVEKNGGGKKTEPVKQ